MSVAHGIRSIIAYLHVILNQGASERVYAYQFTPTSIAYGFGMARQAAETRGTVLSVAAIGTIVATIRLTRANLVDGAAIACAAFPFVLPFEHEPDMVIALLPALLVVFRAQGRTWALGAAGTVLLCTNPFALTQGWPGDRFRQIEIELTEAADDPLLDYLGDSLRRHGAGRPDPTPKNVRAIGRRSRGPEIEAPTLDGRSRIGEVVRAAIVMSVEQIVRSDSRLRSAADESTIHRARVAVRRLRSNLAAFLPVIEFDRGCDLRERLSWLQDGLSKARDADVFIAGMGRLAESLPDVDRRLIDNLRRPFDDERQRAYERIGAMLRDERYVSLLSDLVDAAKHPPLNRSAAEPAREAIPALMGDAWSRLRKRIRRRTDPPSDSELHAIRIVAKRVRYIAEAIAPVAGGAARKLADSAAQMQTILGEQHDAVVARERLRTVAADGERAFVAGELAACANFAALGTRSEWEKAWRRTKRRHRRFKDSFAGRSVS